MTRAEILARYPQASEAFIRRNADSETVGALPNAVPKPSAGKSSEVENSGKEKRPSRARLRVVITSYRARLTDPDNLFPKYLIDGLRYKRLIPDDSPEHIVLELRQEKVATKPEEGTLVEIWPQS